MVQMTPSVDLLTLHLPDEHTVFYEPSLKSAENALQGKGTTMLTEYFHANVVEGESAWGIKYEDFPTKYIWNSEEKLWSLRERLSVNPTRLGG